MSAKVEIHTKSHGTGSHVQSSLENLYGREYCHISAPLFPMGIILIIMSNTSFFYCSLPVEACPLNVHLQLQLQLPCCLG